MSEKCQVCGNGKITHYRQIRKDGVSVVTARCENGHMQRPASNGRNIPIQVEEE